MPHCHCNSTRVQIGSEVHLSFDVFATKSSFETCVYRCVMLCAIVLWQTLHQPMPSWQELVGQADKNLRGDLEKWPAWNDAERVLGTSKYACIFKPPYFNGFKL